MIFEMSRLVGDQRAAFNSNELFRRLSRESEVRYVGCRELTLEERRQRFHANCKNGRADIAFIASGINFSLQFSPWDATNTLHKNGQGCTPPREYVNFEREKGKVFLKAPLVLNGVCVCWKGWISLSHLDGMGFIEFDEVRAMQAASQEPTTSGLHLTKMHPPKPLGTKHHASQDLASQIDKRPRLC